MKRKWLSILLVISMLPIFPKAWAEEEWNLLNENNAVVSVKSSAGESSGTAAFDGDFYTYTSISDYNGVPIYDMNGNSGEDYIVLVTVKTSMAFDFDKIRLYYKKNTAMYLNQPTAVFPENFDIYISETGTDGSWERVYHADTLKDQLITETQNDELWMSSSTDLYYFDFLLNQTKHAQYVRFAIGAVTPWLGDLAFPEIQLFANDSIVPQGYQKLTVRKPEEVSILGKYRLGENYFQAGQEVEARIDSDSVYEITSVKLNGRAVVKNSQNRYIFSMPSRTSSLVVTTGTKAAEQTSLEVLSVSEAHNGFLENGQVPVITYQLNHALEFADKSVVRVNGEEQPDLVQHAFLDCNDPTKLYVILFRDRLTAGTEYQISLSEELTSKAGKALSGSSLCTVTTAEDYTNSSGYGKGAYIVGFPDGTFRPDDYVTREHALIMAKKVAPERDFSFLNSDQMVIRKSELARILYCIRYNKTPEQGAEVFDSLVRDGILRKNESGGYGMEDYVTRGEAVLLINRTLGRCANDCDTADFEIMPYSDVTKDHPLYNDISVATQVMKTTKEITWTQNIKPKTYDVMNTKNHIWEQIPIVSQAQKERGISGGEGGQWMQSIEVDQKDGTLLFGGVDVNGMIRSTDGGKTWHRSNRGFMAGGCVDTAIDPNNSDHVLAIGSSGSFRPQENGIYLSYDMGETWSQVHSRRMDAQRDTRDQLAWDASSYDETIGGSRIAYWSSLWRITDGINNAPATHRSDEVGGLFKSEDGGKSWFLVNSEMSDGFIKVDPVYGYVYLGNDNGFHVSRDGGKTFQTVLSHEPIMSVDCVNSTVYINDSQGVLVSKDYGASFTRVASSTFPGKKDFSDLRNITMGLSVSPANQDRMLVDRRDWLNYRNQRYYSWDGGKTWAECQYDTSKDFYFAHNRQHAFAWHPTDPDKVWSMGGDWIASSTDGGKTFLWDAEGYCGTPPASRPNFNPYRPNVFYAGAQDLFGIKTEDRGKTWEAIKSVGKYWNAYGSYAVCRKIMFAGLSDGWYNPRYLCVTRDGGETWTDTGLLLKNGTARWATSFWQSANNPNVLFAGEYCSRDLGETWEEMQGCAGVMALNYYHNRECYGVLNGCIVVSYDDGKTWLPFIKCKANESVTGSPPTVWDVEYDGINDILYYAVGPWTSAHNLVRVENNLHTNIGKNILVQEKAGVASWQLIALDPRYPDILYVGGYTGRGMGTAAVQRSCDRGESFQNLSSMGDSTSIVKDGPSAGVGPQQIVVEPDTGYLWSWDAGQGWWKFAPPYDN